jgi:hypothetical protein
MKRKVFSILLMGVLVVCLTACGGDDNGGGEGNKVSKTLVVDGEKYYAVNCHADQTQGMGMYLIVKAVTDAEYTYNGHELVAHISPNTVADLKEGQVFDGKNIRIQNYRGLFELVTNTYQWNVLGGNITINKITKMEMTIQLNSLQLEHKKTGATHIISGTAVVDSGVYSSNGTLLSFEDALK